MAAPSAPAAGSAGLVKAMSKVFVAKAAELTESGKAFDWSKPKALQFQPDKATQERFKSIELDILLNEFRSVAEQKEAAPPLEEEEKDEEQEDAAWLKQAGLENLTELAKSGAPISEAEFQEETVGLTPMQVAAIRQRVDSMSDTMRRARRAERGAARAVFPGPSETDTPAAPSPTTSPSSSGAQLAMPTTLDPASIERLTQLTAIASEPHANLFDVSEEDQAQLQCLSLIQLTTVIESNFKASPFSAKPKKAKKIKKSDELKTFGARLEALIARDTATVRQKMADKYSPLFFTNLIDFLSSKGLSEEGLFRKAGGASRVKQLRVMCEERKGDVDFYKLEINIHDACDLLKQFLRELPEPLLTDEYAEAFLLIPRISSHEQRLYTLRLLMLLLPAPHRACLNRLLLFLNKVAENHQRNKMTLPNLAVVFAPTLFYVRGLKGQQMLKEIELQVSTAATLTIMLEHCHDIWNIPPDMLAQARFVTERVHGRRANRPKDLKRILSDKRISARPSALGGGAGRLKWVDGSAGGPAGSAASANMASTHAEGVSADSVSGSGSGSGQMVNGHPVRALVVVMKDGCDHTVSVTDATTASAVLQMLQAQDLYQLAECGGNIGCRRLPAHARMVPLLRINPHCTLVALPLGQFAAVV